MKIISIEKVGRGDKFKISFDDERERVLSKDVVIDFGLRRHDEISEETLLKIQNSELYHDVYSAAIRLLNYRLRTKREVVSRLRQKNFPTDVIDRVVKKLDSLRMIDDLRFAEAFVAEKISSKPIGRRELERRLFEKGVSKETALQTISALVDDSKQLELALKAAQTKLRSLKKFASKRKREKLASFLAGRGFDWDTIKRTVRDTIPEEDDLEGVSTNAGDL